MMQQMKEKIDSSLDVSAIIDTNELNLILPGWGDHVRDEFIGGQKLWQISIKTQDKTQWEAGFDKMMSWNKWMESNRKAIRAILKEKYNYVPK